MFTAFDFTINASNVLANSLGQFSTPSGVVTELFYIEEPGRVTFYPKDMVRGELSCLDLARVLRDLSRGVPLPRVEARILRYVRGGAREESREEVRLEAIAVARRFLHEYGVLTPLLEWEDLQDLAVDEAGEEGLPRVFVRARGFGNAYHPVAVTPSKCEARGEGRRWLPASLGLDGVDWGGGRALSFNEWLLNRASERTGVPVTAFNPRGRATDASLRLRVSMFAEPVARSITAFRKHPRTPWTLPRLIGEGSIEAGDAARLLLAALGVPPHSRDGEPRGVLIYGPMGSGKTTLTAALMNTFPPFLRVAAVQDVDEFRMLPGRTHALLNTREASGLGVNSIGKGDLIMDAMRSGAQFIFVNEVLGEEDASAWVKAVTSGHGGATNLHAGPWRSWWIGWRRWG
ncbi:hypothetical protein GCM10007981_04560 [Thermocladium modestius]|uniref:Bacterial type II secretion system protein E domain-containing protein n=1 Tax=Thermocladium modestius TaxID=62609 RepID=A0A830GT86_9CREN|nr:ATPase, T2SS/T4P/T4SS family [Thermocladium modestius]GGP19724.1 hypothetical protein GCM10007981_04560 [Thermocladium modestius]